MLHQLGTEPASINRAVIKVDKTCVICGDPSRDRSIYCPRCGRLVTEDNKAAKRRALVAALDRELNKFRCEYTGLVLDDEDSKSPLALEFDHPTPGDNSRLVCCAKFVNELKDAMTVSEFRTNIPLLAGHFENGTVIDRNDFRIEHYRTHPPRISVPPELLPPEPPKERWFSPTCKVCGKPPMKGSFYCERCHKPIEHQVEIAAKVAAMIAAYDRDHDRFLCSYTGMVLDLDDPSDPFHGSFDHRFPGRPGNILFCLQVVNLMKSALSDEEFRTIVVRLARHFTTGEPFDLTGIKFEYWR